MSPDIANHGDQYKLALVRLSNSQCDFPWFVLDRSLRPAQPFHCAAERGAVIAAR